MKFSVAAIIVFYFFHASLSLFAQRNYDLKDALQSAKINNPELKAQFFNLGISESDVITAGLRPNPKLNNQSLQVANSNYFAPDTRALNRKNQQIWWQFTKPIQWPGQRNFKIETAQNRLRVSQSEYLETERNILSEVAFKWLEVWTAQKQLDILLMAKTNVDSVYHINQYRYEKQAITETDLLRAQLLSKQFELQIRSSRQNLVVQMRNLKFLVGIQDSIKIDTSDNFNYYVLPQLDSLISEASFQRADLKIARSTIDLSTSNISLQRRQAFPDPELGAIYNPQNTIPYMGVFAIVEIPIFTRNQGEIKKSYLLKQQAEQSYNSISMLMKTEVSNAYSSYLVQRENIVGFQSILFQSQQILDNVRYAYMRGATNIIDYLEAQRSWLDTRQQYYDALQQYKSSYIQLLFTTGFINQLAQ